MPTPKIEYNQEVADFLIEMLPECNTIFELAEISRKKFGEISPRRTVIFTWLDENPEFAARWVVAKRKKWLGVADDIVAIIDDSSNDVLRNGDKVVANNAAVTRSALRANMRITLLKKNLPEIYGDKIEPEGKQQTDINNINSAILALLAKGQVKDES